MNYEWTYVYFVYIMRDPIEIPTMFVYIEMFSVTRFKISPRPRANDSKREIYDDRKLTKFVWTRQVFENEHKVIPWTSETSSRLKVPKIGHLI